MTYPSKLPAAVLAVLFAGPATAAVSLDLIPVDNSGQLTGYNTFDLQMNTPVSDWTSAAILLNVSAGSIYQDAAGSNLPPSPGWFELFPTLEFDTYVGVPGSSIAGGAGDLDGGGTFAFSTAGLSATFYNTANTDIGRFPIGRVTLSDDAVGSWTLLTITADKHLFTLTGDIAAGIMEIDTETIQVPILTAMSIVSAVDGKTLITKTVTDSVRALAGNGMFGEATYEAMVRDVLINMLLDEIDQQQSVGPTETSSFENLTPLAPGTTALYSESNKIIEHYEMYTYSKAEYIQSIAAMETGSANPSLPEPGTVALVGLGGLVMLRRRR